MAYQPNAITGCPETARLLARGADLQARAVRQSLGRILGGGAAGLGGLLSAAACGLAAARSRTAVSRARPAAL